MKDKTLKKTTNKRKGRKGTARVPAKLPKASPGYIPGYTIGGQKVPTGPGKVPLTGDAVAPQNASAGLEVFAEVIPSADRVDERIVRLELTSRQLIYLIARLYGTECLSDSSNELAGLMANNLARKLSHLKFNVVNFLPQSGKELGD